jgi:hypothetical protein
VLTAVLDVKLAVVQLIHVIHVVKHSLFKKIVVYAQMAIISIIAQKLVFNKEQRYG